MVEKSSFYTFKESYFLSQLLTMSDGGPLAG